HRVFIAGSLERRPRARITPKGYAAESPKIERSNVKEIPLHCSVSTDGRPKSPPCIIRPINVRPTIHATSRYLFQLRRKLLYKTKAASRTIANTGRHCCS